MTYQKVARILATFFVFFVCVFLFLREEFSYQVDSIYTETLV